MSIVVTHLGARRHYLVPVSLHRHGLLEEFRTDLYFGGVGTKRLLRHASQIVPLKSLVRLSSRFDSALPSAKVRSYPWLGIRYKFYSAYCRKQGISTKAWLWGGRQFALNCARAGFGDAKAVYAFSSAALETFQAARKQGILCILDHATAPRRAEMDLATKEYELYPGWGQSPPLDPWIDEYTERQHSEAQLADIIICGSTFVQHMIDKSWGLGYKCVIIPLGIKLPNVTHFHKGITEQRPLRVLFVGDEAMRKGLPDLIASLKLLPKGMCEARIAGRIDLTEFGIRESRTVATVLGSVPRSLIADQYAWADVVVIPSTSDTFALVVLEALGYGVPVIASTHTGAADAIVDGKSGFVIPPFAPSILAERLTYLHSNRRELQRLSGEAAKRAQDFSIDKYGFRLVTMLRNKLKLGL